MDLEFETHTSPGDRGKDALKFVNCATFRITHYYVSFFFLGLGFEPCSPIIRELVLSCAVVLPVGTIRHNRTPYV